MEKLFLCLTVVLALFSGSMLLSNIELQQENLKLENTLDQVGYEDIKLNACPMCYHAVTLKPVNASFYIECDNCGLHTGFYSSRKDLVDSWNASQEVEHE